MRHKHSQGGTAVIGKPKANRQQPRVERVPVVVVLHRDGFVQVYGPRDEISVKIVAMLDVAPEGEILAEQYAELALPRRLRPVFVPDNLLAIGSLKDCRTPEQEADRQTELHLVRGFAGERNQRE